MKKFVVCLVAFVFVTAIASVSFGRTMEEEAQAVRNYLDVVDAKLVKAKKANQSAKINLLHAQKNATLARWNKLKKSMEVVPAPAPIVVNPAPVVVVTPPVAQGIALYANGGLDAGLVGFAGNLDYGQSDGLKVRIGGNYISGTNPNGNDSMKAVSAKLGAVICVTPYLPAMGLPFTLYVGGAYLLPLKVNMGRTGKWGVEAYVGANYPIPEIGGVVNFEVGYSGLKYAADQPALKGLDLKIGYGILF